MALVEDWYLHFMKTCFSVVNGCDSFKIVDFNVGYRVIFENLVTNLNLEAISFVFIVPT